LVSRKVWGGPSRYEKILDWSAGKVEVIKTATSPLSATQLNQLTVANKITATKLTDKGSESVTTQVSGDNYRLVKLDFKDLHGEVRKSINGHYSFLSDIKNLSGSVRIVTTIVVLMEATGDQVAGIDGVLKVNADGVMSIGRSGKPDVTIFSASIVAYEYCEFDFTRKFRRSMKTVMEFDRDSAGK
jgi:hypothetical protein